jgi:hypothetical protein
LLTKPVVFVDIAHQFDSFPGCRIHLRLIIAKDSPF